MALPNGSPWCGPGNNPAIWVAGHQNTLVDTPYCYVNGTWQTPHIANLDLNDKFNIRDDPHVIDRHDCGALDINDDGRLDLYCLVGANRGTGVGYNEIYLTRKDGSLRKVLRHGLQRFRGMRTRHTAILKGNGREYVFIASSYGRRSDGRPNRHAMFEKVIDTDLIMYFGKLYLSHLLIISSAWTLSSTAVVETLVQGT